jgi:hypothetical protein
MGKKLREKNTKKEYEKKYGKIVREKKILEKSTGKKYGKKVRGEEVWEKIVRRAGHLLVT